MDNMTTFYYAYWPSVIYDPTYVTWSFTFIMLLMLLCCVMCMSVSSSGNNYEVYSHPMLYNHPRSCIDNIRIDERRWPSPP